MNPGSALHKFAPVISFVLFLVAIMVVNHEMAVYHWRDIRHTLQGFPAPLLGGCAVITLLGYLALSCYDYLALEYAGEKLPYWRVLLTSFLSYAISNNVGHAWISGGSMRYRFYSSWGIPAVAIAKVVVFCGVSYVIGALTVMVGGYLLAPAQGVTSTSLPYGSVQAFVAAGGVALLAWWGLVLFYRRALTLKGFVLAMPAPSLAVRQLLVALLDLLLAALVLYLPLSYYVAIRFDDFVVLYIMAQLAGLVSQVPGGLGVFEGSFLFLAAGRYPADNVVAALLIYRAVYYFMPLLLAGTVLAAYELRLHRLMRTRPLGAAVSVFEAAIPQIFSMLLLLGGGVLLFSGATPAVRARLEWLDYLLPLRVMEASHLLGSIVGVMLLILAQAVWRRIDSAYYATIVLLALGMIASLGKGLDYEEATVLGVMLLSFLPTRKHFYRKSALLRLDLSPQWLALAVIVILSSTWLGFFSYRHVEYSNELWWQFTLHGDASRFLRSLVAILVIFSGFVGYRLLTSTTVKLALPDAAELDRAEAIVRRAGETAACLALAGDKYLLWSASGNSFLMFDITSKYWIAMGDPVGQAEEHEELVWKLRTLADYHNARVAFYQVNEHHLPLYLDLGLALTKLGEEARVPLGEFTLEGRRHASLRQAFNKLERAGLSFEVVPKAGVDAVLSQLQAVSADWLASKKTREKRFSLGFFAPGYLRRGAVALVRQEGRIIAFANLWELDNKAELSMDLMRYEPDAPNGTMEYLIVALLQWGRQQGYHWFNLGMAPLSGLERHPLAPLWNKIGNTIFWLGNEFYNFNGLYQYKNKFDPVWRPRYLAAPTGLALASVLLAVTSLISGNIKGVLTK